MLKQNKYINETDFITNAKILFGSISRAKRQMEFVEPDFKITEDLLNYMRN